jgi:hypothetical protein
MTDDATSANPFTGPPTDLRTLAVKSLRRKQEFRTHLFTYVVVNALIWAVWLFAGLASNDWVPWPLFPLFGWGIGIGFHAWSVYGPPSRPISEAEIDREVKRMGGG